MADILSSVVSSMFRQCLLTGYNKIFQEIIDKTLIKLLQQILIE